MAPSTVRFDEDLKDSVKLLGGHGVISEICNEALREYVMSTGDPETLPLAARQRIKATRERIELARNEERIIHDCWHEYVKVRFAPVIARYGVPKKKLEVIVEEAKMWLFEKYGRLPTDDEIATRFKEYYGLELEYWSTERAKTFRTAIMKEVNEPGIVYTVSGGGHV